MNASLLQTISSAIDHRLSRHFVAKTVFVSLFFAFVFQVPSFNEIPEARPFQGIIEIGQSLFSQMDYHTESHIAKKTLRPLWPLISRTLHISNVWVLYGLFCVLNAILLGQIAVFFLRETGRRPVSMLLTLGLANTYFGFAGFIDVQGWGDILPFVLIMAAMGSAKPFVIGICVFLSSLGDERSLLSIPFLFFWYWHKHSGCALEFKTIPIRPLVLKATALTLGAVGWGIVRWSMVHVFGFSVPTGGVGPGVIFCHETSYMYPGFWSAFESYWLAVFAYIPILFFSQRKLASVLVLIYLCLFTTSCYFVLDISRSLSYGFPIVLLALAYFSSPRKHSDENQTLLGCLAIVNIFIPTARIHGVMRIASPVFVQILKLIRSLVL